MLAAWKQARSRVARRGRRRRRATASHEQHRVERKQTGSRPLSDVVADCVAGLQRSRLRWAMATRMWSSCSSRPAPTSLSSSRMAGMGRAPDTAAAHRRILLCAHLCVALRPRTLGRAAHRGRRRRRGSQPRATPGRTELTDSRPSHVAADCVAGLQRSCLRRSPWASTQPTGTRV